MIYQQNYYSHLKRAAQNVSKSNRNNISSKQAAAEAVVIAEIKYPNKKRIQFHKHDKERNLFKNWTTVDKASLIALFCFVSFRLVCGDAIDFHKSNLLLN